METMKNRLLIGLQLSILLILVMGCTILHEMDSTI